MKYAFWEIIRFTYLVAKLSSTVEVVFEFLVNTIMPKEDLHKLEKAPEKFEKIEKNGEERLIEKFEKLNKPTVRFTGDSETKELEDPFCDPKNPRIITFHDITSAAFKIKSGIEITPCPVRL